MPRSSCTKIETGFAWSTPVSVATSSMPMSPGSIREVRNARAPALAASGAPRRPVRGQDPDERPRGLRRGALAPAGERLIVVGRDCLAPAPVRVLAGDQPLDCAADVGRAQILADRGEPRERTPRAVDEVD